MYIHIYIYAYTDKHIFMYIYVCVYMCVCVCIYIYIYIYKLALGFTPDRSLGLFGGRCLHRVAVSLLRIQTRIQNPTSY